MNADSIPAAQVEAPVDGHIDAGVKVVAASEADIAAEYEAAGWTVHRARDGAVTCSKPVPVVAEEKSP